MTIFEKIVAGEIPCRKVWESETHLAFLNIRPLVPGHTLVIPKVNVGDELFELSDSDYQALMAASKEVAALLKEKFAALRVKVIVEGFEVPHVHIHLLPATKRQSILELKESEPTDEELDEVLKKITTN